MSTENKKGKEKTTLSCGDLQIHSEHRKPGENYFSPLGEGSLELILINGLNGEQYNYRKAKNREISLFWEAKPHRKFIEYTVEIKNLRGKNLLLETRLGITFSPRGKKYWDGWRDPIKIKPGKKYLATNADPVEEPAPLRDFEFPDVFLGKSAVEIHQLMGGQFGDTATPFVFPASGIYGDKTGIALGVHPDSFHSYFSSGIEPCGENSSFFYSAVKMVIAPGDVARVRFVIMPFLAEEEYRSILDAYYHAFPRYFSSDKDVPEQIFGSCVLLNYLDTYRLDSLIHEYIRRTAGRKVWSWLYAPHQKTGVIDPEEDTWDQQGEAWSKWNAPELQGISLEGFRSILKKVIETMEPEVPQFSYVILQRCRWSLAAQKYPDAILRRSDGTPNVSPMMCVLPGEGQIITVFAYGNSFARDVKRGIKRFLNRYGNCGIAFDNAAGTGMHFTDKVLPGSSFTHGKIYSAEALPYKSMMQYVHSIKIGQRRRFVAANTPGHYAIATCVDVGLLENRDPMWRRNMRHLLGSKPFVWSAHAAKNKHLVELQALEAILEGISLYGGPFNSVKGKWKKYRKEVHSLMRLGWTPIRGARINAPLRLERFGKSLPSSLVAGNPTDKTYTATLTLNPPPDNKTYTLFVPEKEHIRWEENSTGGLTTRFRIGARKYKILKGIISLSLHSATIKTGDISWKQRKLSARISLPRPSRGKIAIYLPEGIFLKKCTLNGKIIDTKIQLSLPSSVIIEIETEDKLFIAPNREEVKRFPFLHERGDTHAEIIPLGGENASVLCQRLSDFFAFWDIWNRSLDEKGRPLDKRITIPPPPLFPDSKPRPIPSDPLIPLLEKPEKILRLPIVKKGDKRKNLIAVGVIQKGNIWEHCLSPKAHQALKEGRPIIETQEYEGRKMLIVSGKDADLAREALFSLLSLLDEIYQLKERRI